MSPRLMYGLTLVSYALIHAVRTAWSYSKTYMQQEPFMFTTKFLGELDLTVLISLAVSLKTIGWVGEKIGYKLFLLIGMAYLSVLCIIISILIIKQVTVHWPYIFLLCMSGISMCTGWPSCLSIVSKYYPPKQNSFLICVWNGCSQFGDLIAVFLGYLIIQWSNLSQGYLILVVGLLILVTMFINLIFLVPSPPEEPISAHLQNQINKYAKSSEDKENTLKQHPESEEESHKSASNQIHNYRLSSRQQQQPQQVNFLNVWCLPSVPSYVVCYACLKAVNAIIMNWLFMYLFSIGLHRLSGVITLGWSISIFAGNLLMGYYNKSTSKIGLIIPLIFTGFVFAYLGVEYRNSGSINYSVLLILSGVCFGGPFGLIGSKVALVLGEHPEIKPKKNALGAIISLMQGFGQLMAAIFVLIIPYLGLRRLFYLPTMLCIVSCAILFYQHKKGLSFSREEDIRRRELQLKQLN